MTNSVTIWTIGHSTRAIEEFLALLAQNGIELVVDVRSLPGSRRYPHFNQEPLAATLADHRIGYLWLEELGGRRKLVNSTDHSEWRNKAFQAYAQHMETEAFRKGAERVIALAAVQRLALMCAEGLWWRCHRSMIADYLVDRGAIVLHIMEPGSVVPHPRDRLRGGSSLPPP